MPIGTTLFEFMIRREAEKQAQFERQKELDRQQGARNAAAVQQAWERKQAQDAADFDRQLKLAELQGTLAQQEGAKQAPMMGTPQAQQAAELAYRQEAQRLPQALKMFEATKLPIELMKTQRAGLLEEGRMIRASEANSLRRKIADNQNALAQARIDLDKAKTPLERKLMEQRLAAGAREHQNDILKWLGTSLRTYSDRAKAAASMGGVDPMAEQLTNQLNSIGALISAGQMSPEEGYATAAKLVAQDTEQP